MDFLTNLIPSFGNTAFTLLAFVIALSVIVAVHEYGHYIVGRWSGIHADVFSIGFGPVIWRRVDRRGTVWQIAALPFGGYVKFKGDSNAASMGADREVRPQRDTMMGAPLWARAATVAAGPLFNFIFSALVFAAILIGVGQATTPLTIASLPTMPGQYEMDLMPGDRLLAIEGQELDFDNPGALDAIIASLPSQISVTYTIERNGMRQNVVAPQPRPTIVQSITPRSPADDAGLKIGDVILSLDGQAVYKFQDMIAHVDRVGAAPIAVEIWSDGETSVLEMTPRLQAMPQEDGSMRDEPKIGVGGGLLFEPQTESLGIIDALAAGIRQVGYIITQSLNGIKYMISGVISSCNLSGPVGIAEASGSMASQGFLSFLSFMAVMSTAVGLLNLFPIPILDGGHLLFHAYEAITGAPPSQRALEILMAAGFALIGTLMLFAIGNDLFFCR